MQEKAENKPLAYHFQGTEVTRVLGGGGSGRTLPSALVIPPGRYSVHGETYSLETEGLYRFLYPRMDNQQRIVYRNDPVTLLGSISWTASHGSRDNELTMEEWIAIAARQKLIVTCGNIARLGIRLLVDAGIPSRRVGARSLGERNDYDIGHVLMETKLEGRWVLADLDVKYLFRRNGKRLSLLEAVDAIADDDYELEPLSKAAAFAVASFFDKQGYDFGMYMESAFCGEEAVRAWYRRIMMIPIQYGESESCFTARSDSVRRKAEELYPKLRYLSREHYERKFHREDRI